MQDDPVSDIPTQENDTKPPDESQEMEETAQAKQDVAFLPTYIHQAYTAIVPDDITKPWIAEYGFCKNPKPLRKDRINRILVYPGSFNPPHQGHMDVLHHAWSKCGIDFYAVAVVVLPFHRERLEGKNERRDDQVPILDQRARARLWHSDPRFPKDWAWIHRGSHDYFEEFQQLLIDLTHRDGLAIEFAGICGADGLNVAGIAPSFGCVHWLISDCGRTTKMLGADSMDSPLTLQDYGSWRKVVRYDERDLANAEVCASRKAALARFFEQEWTDERLEHAVSERLKEVDDEYADILVCYHKRPSFQQLRYLRVRDQKDSSLWLSSTRLRRALKDDDREDAESMALSPDLLFRFWNRVQAQMEKENQK